MQWHSWERWREGTRAGRGQMCDTGASTQRLHAHLAWREGPRSKSGEGRDSAHGTSRNVPPQMSHLVPELLAEGPEFQHGAPEGPGREPRGHAGPGAPRRRHRPPAQHRLGVAREALQQQQQPVPTGKHGWECRLGPLPSPRQSDGPCVPPSSAYPLVLWRLWDALFPVYFHGVSTTASCPAEL